METRSMWAKRHVLLPFDDLSFWYWYIPCCVRLALVIGPSTESTIPSGLYPYTLRKLHLLKISPNFCSRAVLATNCVKGTSFDVTIVNSTKWALHQVLCIFLSIFPFTDAKAARVLFEGDGRSHPCQCGEHVLVNIKPATVTTGWLTCSDVVALVRLHAQWMGSFTTHFGCTAVHNDEHFFQKTKTTMTTSCKALNHFCRRTVPEPVEELLQKINAQVLLFLHTRTSTKTLCISAWWWGILK